MQNKSSVWKNSSTGKCLVYTIHWLFLNSQNVQIANSKHTIFEGIMEDCQISSLVKYRRNKQTNK